VCSSDLKINSHGSWQGLSVGEQLSLGQVSLEADLAMISPFIWDGGAKMTLAAMTTQGTPPYRLGLMVVDLDGHEAFGHQGFWNTFAFHVPDLDLTVAGCILNHDATNGRELARRLVVAIAGAFRE